MSICPFAIQRLLPESASQRRIEPRAYIQHSAGGHAELYGWWQSDASHGLESHFFVADDQTKGYEDGDLVQYMDTHTKADANGEANGFAISCETASSTSAAEPWTPAQVATIIRLILWLHQEHPAIALRAMQHPIDAGLAWHVQFGAPGPWTQAKGKVCPGPARVEQFRNVIIPAVAGPHPTQTEEPLMVNADDEKKIRTIVREEVATAVQDAVKAALSPVAATLARGGEVRDAVVSIKRHAVTGDNPDLGKVPERELAALARIEQTVGELAAKD